MLRTRICELLGIEHPVVLGGMGSATSPRLVTAVSAAGGLGVLGATRQSPEELASDVAAIRAATHRPFGLNLLLFLERPGQFDGLLAAQPRVISTAWAWPEQDLAGYVARAHAIGALAMHMVSTVSEAERAAEIVGQKINKMLRVLDVIAKSSVHENPVLLPHIIDWHMQVVQELGPAGSRGDPDLRQEPQRKAA